VTVPGRTWDRVSSPGEAGWSAEQLEAAWRIADDIGSGAIVVVHHGRIVAEWGETTEKYDVFSARKQLLSGLLGIAAADGALALDATLGDLGIDDKGGLTDAEKSATVRDLLTSRSGVYHDAAYEARAHRRARPRRGSHPPGTFFHYNNWDFNALGTIFERVSGESVFEAFERRIAQPLEMEDFRREEDTRYERTGGSEHAAYLFEMTARDLARYGLLWLMRGNWGERRIIPGEWVDESTRPYVHPALNDLQSFGYLWWIYPATPGLFGASGKGNQKVVIWPERDLVVVHLASTKWLGIFGSQVGDRDFWRLFYAIAAADTSRDATEDPSFAQGPLRPAAGSHEE
jgi:CubicO group peptidase (beta-lactamase class C family)